MLDGWEGVSSGCTKWMCALSVTDCVYRECVQRVCAVGV